MHLKFVPLLASMRVLLITKKLPFPSNDGETIAVRNMIDNYLSLGLNVSVLSMITPKHPYSDTTSIPARYKEVEWHTQFVASNNSKWKVLMNFFSHRPIHIIRFTSNDFKQKITTILDSGHFDIVQLEGLMLSGYVDVIRERSEAKIIYRSHNREGVIWQRLAKEQTNLLKKYIFNLQGSKLLDWERRVIEQVDAILAISSKEASEYKVWKNDLPIAFLPVGFDSEKQVSNKASVNPKSVFFIGALDWIPNMEGLIRFINHVWPLVLNEIPEAEFHIAGRHAPEGFASNFHKSIIFHGEVESAQDFVANYAISIVPLWAGSGLKIKVVESLATGKPLVTTSVGAEGLPSGTDSFIHLGDTYEKLAEKLVYCLNQIDEVNQLASKGREFITESMSNTALRNHLRTFINQII